MSGVLRSLPVLFPRVVTTTIGRPVSRNVLARWPPEASYSATWSRTQPYGLGSYSPSSGDMAFTYPRRTVALRAISRSRRHARSTLGLGSKRERRRVAVVHSVPEREPPSGSRTAAARGHGGVLRPRGRVEEVPGPQAP